MLPVRLAPLNVNLSQWDGSEIIVWRILGGLDCFQEINANRLDALCTEIPIWPFGAFSPLIGNFVPVESVRWPFSKNNEKSSRQFCTAWSTIAESTYSPILLFVEVGKGKSRFLCDKSAIRYYENGVVRVRAVGACYNLHLYSIYVDRSWQGRKRELERIYLARDIRIRQDDIHDERMLLQRSSTGIKGHMASATRPLEITTGRAIDVHITIL